MLERTNHFFQYKHARLHYSKYGVGAKTVLCFHGFGQTSASFQDLEGVLAEDYTLYVFDLFFHGKSEWGNGENYLSEEFWISVIESFLEEKGITKFSLLGYSIGARLVWSLAEHKSSNVQEIIVLAPDGIKNSIWFNIAVETRIGRSIFRFVIKNKKRISSILTIGKKTALAPKGVIKFAESQLDTEEQRYRVFMTWMVYRKLKANIGLLAQEMNRCKIPLTVYLGSKDKIITYKKVKQLLEKLNDKELIYLEAGHSNLIYSVSQYIRMNHKSN